MRKWFRYTGKTITFLMSTDGRSILSFSNALKALDCFFVSFIMVKVAKARKTSPLNSSLKWLLSTNIHSQPNFLHKEKKKWYLGVWRRLHHSITNIQYYTTAIWTWCPGGCKTSYGGRYSFWYMGTHIFGKNLIYDSKIPKDI